MITTGKITTGKITTGKITTGKNRIITDQFYTKDSTASFCVQKFYELYPFKRNIIEPSAGDGAFIHYLCRFNIFGSEYFRAFDIEPKNIRQNYIIPIEQQNFLEYNFDDFILAPATERVCFIGNPPFGKQSSMAKKFIKHITSWEKSGIIAFILPKSFKKFSMQKCFPLDWHLIEQYEIPKNSFIIGEKSHDVPCVFQIWENKNFPRWVPTIIHPKHYKFVCKKDNPDFSLRRVGVNASKIDTDTNKSEQSHYFIKLDPCVNKTLFLENYSHIIFDTDNTVGPKSISKQEFIAKLNICV